MKLSALSLGAFLIVAASSGTASAQQVRLVLENGLVTLDATNATPAAILAEWARVGNTRIIDGDRVPGTPLTLKLDRVPERQALDIILRSAAGYIAAARPAGAPGSAFDRIVVMPVSVNAAAAKAGPAPISAPVAVAQQQVVEPVMGAQEVAGDAGDANAVGDGTGAEQPASSTNFDYANPQRYFAARAAQQQQQQQAETGQADDEAVPSATPTGPAGFSTGTLLSTPGTIPVPKPQQGQPGQPGAAGPASNQPPANPYGLPADAAPGTSTAAPMEPDRSKYINPYAPTPPRPPGQ